ncbi:MAG: cohesin domain-containing protein, partial [Saprospiraceae bacterium]|nr:cohesin domain-containing protein [Saprospiraceae bacterium]
MKKLKLIVSIWALLTSAPLFAQQPLVLQLPDTIVNSGDTLRLDILARQFTKIVSAQFSINWNPNVIRYVSFEETNLTFVAVGNSDAANGNLRFSWFDIQGVGQTLADGRSILRLKFFVNGNPGDQTNVNISGTPLAIQIAKATGEPNKFEDIPLSQQNGVVAVAGAFNVIFNVKNVDCNGDG